MVLPMPPRLVNRFPKGKGYNSSERGTGCELYPVWERDVLRPEEHDVCLLGRAAWRARLLSGGPVLLHRPTGGGRRTGKEGAPVPPHPRGNARHAWAQELDDRPPLKQRARRYWGADEGWVIQLYLEYP